jgi:DNA primase
VPLCHGIAARGVIIVEGPFDLAALLQGGFAEAHLLIALLGTGHTRGLQLLHTVADGLPIYVALDQDAPGQLAARKLADALRDWRRHASVLTWAGGKDCGDLLLRGDVGRRIFATALAAVAS